MRGLPARLFGPTVKAVCYKKFSRCVSNWLRSIWHCVMNTCFNVIRAGVVGNYNVQIWVRNKFNVKTGIWISLPILSFFQKFV